MIHPVLIDQPRRARAPAVAAEPAPPPGRSAAARAAAWTFLSREDIFPLFPGILLAILGVLTWAFVRSRHAIATTSPAAGGRGDWS